MSPTGKPKAAMAKKAAAKKPAKRAAKPAAKKAVKAAKAAKPVAKKAAKSAAKPVAKKAAKPVAKKAAKPAPPAATWGPRADLGAPIDGFFAKQPPALRPVLETLRAMIEEVVPAATSSIKWGMPVYELGGAMMCAIGGHKAHVNLVLAGPPDAFDDPDELLEGSAKGGRHLKLTSLDGLPRDQVRGWLRTAADAALAKM